MHLPTGEHRRFKYWPDALTGMLSEALAYPRRGNAVFARHALGAVFILFGSLLVPTFLIYGYLVRVVRGVAAGDPEPPEWDEWEDLLIDGLKYFAVTFIYGLPVLVLGAFAAVLGTFVALSFLNGSETPSMAIVLVPGFFFLMMALAASMAAYLLPAAIVHFALEGEVEAAFRLRTILGNALSWPYAVAWLKTIVVGIVLGVLGTILIFVFLVGLLVYFYLAVVATYLLTAGYLEAAGEDFPTEVEAA